MRTLEYRSKAKSTADVETVVCIATVVDSVADVELPLSDVYRLAGYWSVE